MSRFQIGNNARGPQSGEENGNFRHGHYVGGTGSPEYKAYQAARQRCTNPNYPRFDDWGGRGIEFRFTSFEEFLAEVGLKPSPVLTLDRIENDGHYEHGNVKWSTPHDQRVNARPRRSIAERDSVTGRYQSGS